MRIHVPFLLVSLLGTAGLGSAQDADGSSSKQFDVHCQAVNDFGYIASAAGTLKATSLSPNNFFVRGTLHVATHLFGEDEHARDILVQGQLDVQGSLLQADVLSGADDLDSLTFVFRQNATSNIAAFDSTQYQTQCSREGLPRMLDLTPGKLVRFETLDDGRQRAAIEVFNAGNVDVPASSVQVRFANLQLTAALPDSLATGNSGALQVELPANTLMRCGNYKVILDRDHALQTGALDPFANDTSFVATPCLTWYTPMNDDVLGVPASPFIRGLTLDDIVNSRVVARSDGALCSACHNPGSSRNYRPATGEKIGPSTQIGGRSWNTPGGWVLEFRLADNPPKPEYLQQAFQRWLDDGGQ